MTTREQLSKIFKLFNKQDKIKLAIVCLINIFLSFLDLLGVALVGIIGAITVYGIQSKTTGNRINSVLEFLNLQSSSLKQQVLFIGIMAAVIFIIKTLSSIILIRKTLFFISRRGALISSNFSESLFSKPISFINQFTQQELIFVTTTGIDIMTTRIIGTSILIISDFALLIVLFSGLALFNPSITISIFVIFSLLTLVTNRFMKLRAFNLGNKEALYGVKSNERISEILNTYRESVVKNRRFYYVNSIKELRFNLAEVTANRNFMPNVNKYVMETALIVGSILIAGVQFALNDATHAIANLTIFIASATRIAPALLRIQQGFLSVRSGLGTVSRTLEIIDQTLSIVGDNISNTMPDFIYNKFIPKINICDLNYKYNSESTFNLSSINLDISPGEQIAIVGSSGAGKTTLVDLILGVLSPSSGSVEISNSYPLEAFRKWAGAIAYVPQDIVILNGTIWENVALGFDHDFEHEHFILEALKLAHLEEHIKSLPEGLLTKVGERGHKLSGGQRQRLGIARALFTKPKILVLDEATSALDGETEADISEAIKSLKGSTTVLIIAHRLSSVKSADKVIYMEKGKISASGTFDEVRKIAPDFDKQANLMGL
jgi:ABC-type multidrug transport system fused ATPase/permease subunit